MECETWTLSDAFCSFAHIDIILTNFNELSSYLESPHFLAISVNITTVTCNGSKVFKDSTKKTGKCNCKEGSGQVIG